MGPLEMPWSRGKGPKRSGEARKAAEKPPTGPRMPCRAHAARPPNGVSCHPVSKTAQPPLPHKEKPAKRYEHLAGSQAKRGRWPSAKLRMNTTLPLKQYKQFWKARVVCFPLVSRLTHNFVRSVDTRNRSWLHTEAVHVAGHNQARRKVLRQGLVRSGV